MYSLQNGKRTALCAMHRAVYYIYKYFFVGLYGLEIFFLASNDITSQKESQERIFEQLRSAERAPDPDRAFFESQKAQKEKNFKISSRRRSQKGLFFDFLNFSILRKWPDCAPAKLTISRQCQDPDFPDFRKWGNMEFAPLVDGCRLLF